MNQGSKGVIPINRDKVKKVLVFAHMGIGNLIMFIPTLRAFKNYFPKAKFSLVVSKKHLFTFKQLLEGFNLIDEFIVFDGKHASVLEKIRFINKGRKSHFDLLVKNFLGGINFMLGSLGIPYRMGHVSSPDFPITAGFVFNYPVKMQKGEHEIYRNLQLSRAIVKEEVRVIHELPQIGIPDTIQQKAEGILGPESKSSPLIAMQIGTSAVGDWKEWSPFKFGELAKQLLTHYDAKIAILGDSNAIDKGKIVENIGVVRESPLHLINLIGKTSILEAAAVIKKCRLLVSNDAGLMWVAQAVRTPVVAIYGPTDYTRTGPIGKRDKIIKKDLICSPCYKSPTDYSKAARCKSKKCLNLITPQEVLVHVAEFL